MAFDYRIASVSELDALTEARIAVLREANRLSDDVDMTRVKACSREYYERALAEDTHVAILVFDGERVIGTGGVSFFGVMPTFHNPTGRKAYIMNMYTDPAYRRQGVAAHTLGLLLEEARRRGITAISLEATEMGRPLYQKLGFVDMESEMEWRNDAPETACAEERNIGEGEG